MRTLLISSALAITTLSAATTMFAAPAPVPTGAQTGSGEFCLKTMNGDAKCEYRSMAQCEQSLPQGSRDQCVERSQVTGTTGSGTSSSPDKADRSKPIPPPAPPQ